MGPKKQELARKLQEHQLWMDKEMVLEPKKEELAQKIQELHNFRRDLARIRQEDTRVKNVMKLKQQELDRKVQEHRRVQRDLVRMSKETTQKNESINKQMKAYRDKLRKLRAENKKNGKKSGKWTQEHQRELLRKKDMFFLEKMRTLFSGVTTAELKAYRDRLRKQLAEKELILKKMNSGK